ncbi:MAG: hypothetical protein Q7R57_04050 [Dehalococcoidales bacterium]|nr:hypothetical protein [Dehalococcoidales bacterium]
MAEHDNRSALSGDTAAIKHFKQAIAEGKHWYIALLEAIGLWASSEETYKGREYRYLISGEAFDWLLLAERLCDEVEGLPEDEKNALLFQGRPLISLTADEVKKLIGSSKYRHYLNYFYGVTVEMALILATEEEVHKERSMQGYSRQFDAGSEAFRRVYGASRSIMLKQFRKEKGYPQRRSVSLSEVKEFTYWLFKYRLAHTEKARVASDTKKALDFLRRQWAHRGYGEAFLSPGDAG